MANYKEAPLATRPKTLDPAEYFNLSHDYRRAEEKRASLRAQLKRQYLEQLNNPHRKELIEDPALTRWTYARTNNNYFRPTAKTSLIGGLFGVLPLFILYVVFKTDRDKREAKIKAGTYERPYKLST
ncbi:NADH dehydrogenase [ubiquinone] 1 beta subcomplex subunit 4-like [Sinocyclocheilus rhinocerous]|uniref:NADH dehydrogenase [ubiquinone] 1 beta subcomplex subunit 4 n=1 Tax=Sinocyclocheilus rhinocerous TaxID=307959 RepID=A0A673NPN1_9TELE|nr:PREDICTED: NADH dehydrogenase [ubiquinone] 1 beta subcomplex subunit 4-like [Sinocyclocheilus rhinocerous]